MSHGHERSLREVEALPRTVEQGGFLEHRWHDLDLEAQALAIWERAKHGPRAPQPAGQVWALLKPLLDRDRAARKEEILSGLGAERMLVEEAPFLARLLLHMALNRYAIWMGDGVRYFSKHGLGGFKSFVPAEALAMVAKVHSAGVRVEQIAIFRDEGGPDPILAVLVEGEWYALYSWA